MPFTVDGRGVPDDDMVAIPAEFYRSLSDAESEALWSSGWLNAGQCARLWRMTDRHSEPPPRLQVMVSREDIDSLFPPKPGGPNRRARRAARKGR